MMILYPFTAAARAKPIPVFPEVGSMIVQPGLSSPAVSAASIMRLPIRSLTEPPALKYSHFTTEGEKKNNKKAKNGMFWDNDVIILAHDDTKTTV